MAKQRYGINDGFRGTVGTVIGYLWRGKWCLRSRPRFVHNPRTARQQCNRQQFKLVVQMAGEMKEALRHGLHERSMAQHMTECNYFYRINKGCFAMVDNALEVDYENLMISDGDVVPVVLHEPVCDGATVAVPFEADDGERHGSSADQVFLYAWCPDCGEGLLSLPAYRRTGLVSIELPIMWQGCEVHLYAFVEDVKHRTSVSLYVGVLVGASPDVSEEDENEAATVGDSLDRGEGASGVSGRRCVAARGRVAASGRQSPP